MDFQEICRCFLTGDASTISVTIKKTVTQYPPPTSVTCVLPLPVPYVPGSMGCTAAAAAVHCSITAALPAADYCLRTAQLKVRLTLASYQVPGTGII